ncbi:MAG: hypothetical protein ABSA93_13550 [Streptosporangiaceae bacterium]|jgi:hypothetical protein
MAALALPATALASTATTSSQRTVAAASTYTPAFNLKIAKCEKVNASTEHCLQAQRIPLSSLNAAQRAQRKRDDAALATRARSRGISAAAAITAPAQCNFSTIPFALTGVRYPSRFVSCSDVLVSITQITVTDGVPSLTGQFEYEDQSWVILSATSSDWTHGMQVLGYLGFGDLSDGVSGYVYSECFVDSGECIATSEDGEADPQPVTIASASTSSFEWAESDAGPATVTAGDVDNLDSVVGVEWDITSGGLSTIVDDRGYLDVRCDSQASSTDGCVDNGFIPTLYLSLAQYGASAAMVQWAQINMNAHWGLQGVGDPLTYLVDPIIQANNREVICDDGTFVNMGTAIGGDYGDSDSCDEFPFAATYQSGAFNIYPGGSACAQVEAVEGSPGAATEALAWNSVTTLATPTYNEPCVRGHIPSKLNSGVGGAYGNFILANRLVDLGDGAGDPFWVAVTA